MKSEIVKRTWATAKKGHQFSLPSRSEPRRNKGQGSVELLYGCMQLCTYLGMAWAERAIH